MGQSNQEPLVSFDQAKALKALGFNWPVNHLFSKKGNISGTVTDAVHNFNDRNEGYSRPTISQAIRWFRIEKGILSWVQPSNENPLQYQWWHIEPQYQNSWCGSGERFADHDKASSSLLTKLIELTIPQQ